MTSHQRIVRLTVSVIALALWAMPSVAQQNHSAVPALTQETYSTPPDHIAEAVLAPRYNNVTLTNPSPDGNWFMRQRGDGPPSIKLFAKPFYRLGGDQIDYVANRNRAMTTRSGALIELIRRETGESFNIEPPSGSRVTGGTWSPDGSKIAYFVHSETETHIYVADVATRRSRQVTRTPVMAGLNTDFSWTGDSRSIVTVLVPANRGPAPVQPAVPEGPQVRLTTPETNSVRTYPDLLENPKEMEMLEYYTTGQLAVVEVERRRERLVGQPAMISNVEVSPDGMYAQVATRRKPFSYIVPARQVGSAVELWNMQDGTVITTLNEEALRDGSPADTSDADPMDPEKRSFAWRPDGVGLSFLQAEPRSRNDTSETRAQQGPPAGPGGQARAGARGRDRVMLWVAPFGESDVQTVYTNNTRLSSVDYSEDASILFLTEQQGQNTHEFAVFVDTPGEKHTLWRGEGRGGFGGFGRGGGSAGLQDKRLANGMSAVRISSDGSVFRTGVDNADDPNAEGPVSFINKINIRTGDSTHVYESDNNGVFERVLTILNDDATELIVTRESPTDVPDSYYRNLTTGTLTQMTENVDYTPDITNAQRRRYMVTRVDGIKFKVDVTLPQNWSGERLPGMIWFYPREYTDQDDYSETLDGYNKNSFPNVGLRSMDILVREGYAVIEPDAPIIGDNGRMNDNYVHDLRNNLAATIDFLDKEGIVDRERMAVGGHSYGAFSTVNAMVHTPFFKAGIAGDGNYNRTLTPFAFQSERRTFWQSKDTYFAMSPIFNADHMTGALLMYHGEHDQNVGTFPIHSWRMFESLEMLGKTASLYVYPFEDHGPATEETTLDLWGRWTAWLDLYVKNANQAAEKVTTDSVDGDGGSLR